MSRILFGAITLLAASAFAQADGGTEAAVPAPTAPAAAVAPIDTETLKRELDATRKEIKDLRDELRAQAANAQVAEGWSESFTDEKRKLEVFAPDGYFRVRPELFNKMDLGRGPDPSGYGLWPRPYTSAPNTPLPKERTVAGVNMRFRFEPTLNVSEEVRIRTQIDMLDNVIFGSTPDYAFSRAGNIGYAWDRDIWAVTSESQVAPRSGQNALQDSIALKRVWGEVSTPIGILRFGRMGSHWGLGMLRNDGNCLDCDWGDTVDRLMFVAEPISGYFIAPMLDFNAEGPSSPRTGVGGQPFDLSNADDAHSVVIAVARRDTDSQARALLDSNKTLFNYGAHFTYRWQRNEPFDFYGAPFLDEGGNLQNQAIAPDNIARMAQLYSPDVWIKLERKDFRIELEAAAHFGNVATWYQTGQDIESKNQVGIGMLQFGGVLQGEYRLLDSALNIQVELGFASGDIAPGLGNRPRRKSLSPTNNTQAGDIDGQQFACVQDTPSISSCPDNSVNNFRFNRDYRVDMILFREILGGVTDAFYVKPTIKYRLVDGFNVWGSVIYSRAIFPESTPSSTDANLGFEINLGARYETEDGFFAELRWGILFPLGGFADNRLVPPPPLENAQALRGTLGIKF